MKRFWIITSAFFALFANTYGQSGWEKTIGGNIGDSATDVIETSDGGYLVVGSSYSYGAGGSDIYLIKLNSMGDVTWAKTYGTSDNEGGAGVKEAADGGYVIATTWDSNAGCIKVSASGSLEWANYTGAFYSYGFALTEFGGGYAVSGGEGYGGNIIGLSNFSSNGTLLKRLKIEVSLYPRATTYAATRDVSGRVLMTGVVDNIHSDLFIISSAFGPNCASASLIKSPADDLVRDIIQTADTEDVIIGSTLSFGAGGSDIYVVRMRGGVLVWAKTYGTSGYEIGNSVTEAVDGGLVLGCDVHGIATLIKTDRLGNIQWSAEYSSGQSNISKVITTSDGGFLAVGHASGKVFVIKTDANGNTGCVQTTSSIIASPCFPTIDQVPATNVNEISSSATAIPNFQTGSGGLASDPCIVAIEDEDFVSDGLSIYPNPATDEFSIKMPERSPRATVRIYDLMGKDVVKPFNYVGNEKPISVQSLASGVYVVSVSTSRRKENFILRKE